MLTEGASGREPEPKPCVFCDIRDGQQEASVVAETEDAFAIMALEGHVLVLPRKHINTGSARDNIEEILSTYRLAYSLVSPVENGLNATGISVVTNIGKSAGQEVDHLHVHLINRNEGDRKVRYGHSPRLQRQELNELASRVKAQIKKN